MEVFEKIKSNPLCRGVTFSGGEPFCQAAPLYELGKMLKEAGYEIACYTGSTFEQLLHGSEEQKSLLRILDIEAAFFVFELKIGGKQNDKK